MAMKQDTQTILYYTVDQVPIPYNQISTKDLMNILNVYQLGKHTFKNTRSLAFILQPTRLAMMGLPSNTYTGLNPFSIILAVR